MSERRIEYFDCQCESLTHMVRFEVSCWDDDVELLISVHLSQWRGFFGRTWLAVKYVLGFDRDSGDYDVTMLKHEDIDRLSSMIDDYRELRSKYENQSAASAVRAED